MKKITAAILAMTIVLSFAGCKNNNSATDESTTDEVMTEEVVTEKATEEIVEEEKKEENIEDKKDEVKEDKKEDKKDEVNSDKNEEVKDETPAEKTEEPAKKDESLGNTLLAFFNKQASAGKSSEEIADAISQMPEILFACQSAEVEEGWLAGFKEDITGFDKAVKFGPIIGSIPFVGYIFEVENPDEFIKEIKPLANLRWNICTEAEEMVVGKNGNKVFFVMCNKSLED